MPVRSYTQILNDVYDAGTGAFKTTTGGTITTDSADVAVVGSATSSTELAAANADRRGLSIFNNSSAALYVKFGTGASDSSFSIKMAAGAYLEVPFGYTGVIEGAWASVDGAAFVTEFTGS